MSLIKAVCIISVSLALILAYGCGTKKAENKAASKSSTQQHDMNDGQDHSGHSHSAQGKKADDKAEGKTAETSLKPQTTCPVMGGAIDKTMYVDKGGQRIYMCCEHCRDKLTKDFDTYLKKLNDEMGQQAETL